VGDGQAPEPGPRRPGVFGGTGPVDPVEGTTTGYIRLTCYIRLACSIWLTC
jgi:hypothetical protein